MQKENWITKDGFCSKCGAWKGQFGLEPDFNLYIKHLCDIYDQIFRVLKKSGTCFVNLGDTYSSQSSGLTNEKAEEWKNKGDGLFNRLHRLNTNNMTTSTTPKPQRFDKKNYGGLNQKRQDTTIQGRGRGANVPDKCLCLIPERFCIEMVNRGWILRNRICWYKRNAMPTSVKDRLGNRWEHVFFFVKNRKYYFDLDSIRKKYSETSLEPFKRPVSDRSAFNYRVREACKVPLQAKFGDKYNATKEEIENYDDKYGSFPLNKIYSVGARMKRQNKNKEREYDGRWGNDGNGMAMPDKWNNSKGGNPGDHWDITTRGHPFAHFAVYPEELCEMPIKAGCPEFVCNKCGKPKEKIIEKKLIIERESNDTGKVKDVLEANDKRNVLPRARTGIDGHNEYKQIGWKECGCNARFSGGIVLDPFFGSGTTGLVALKLNRKFIGIELNKEYIKIAEERLKPYLEQTKL